MMMARASVKAATAARAWASAQPGALELGLVEPEEVPRLVKQRHAKLFEHRVLVFGDALDVAPEQDDLREARLPADVRHVRVSRAREQPQGPRIEPRGDVD